MIADAFFAFLSWVRLLFFNREMELALIGEKEERVVFVRGCNSAFSFPNVERRLKYLCSLCDEFTRLCGVSCFVFELSWRSSLSSSSFVSIGSGERQQSGRLRGGFVEDRNERIQWGKRPKLLIKTDIVFFSLSLFKLSFSFSFT